MKCIRRCAAWSAARFALIASLACVVASSGALAAEAGEDHPLVARYPGSEIQKHESEDFTKYSLVVGLTAQGMKFDAKEVEGRVTRLVYANPKDRSTLEIFRNYREALEKAGATILFACEVDACGPAYARSAWGRFNGLFVAADGDPRYLAATLTQGDRQAYVAVLVGKARTQVDVVEVKAMDTGLVAVDPAALAKDIEKAGSVRVYGILFDFDKADIRAESKPALDAIATLLKEQPDLSIFVVGHTDSTGELVHNLKLSRARAAAVAKALTSQYGIAAARLDPHGVGPLAPVAPNGSEEGRRLNRRVELVKR